MTVDSLIEATKNLPEIVASSLGALAHVVKPLKDEAPGKRFGIPNSIPDYFLEQQKRLVEIQKDTQDAVSKHLPTERSNTTFYVMGSIARLEYMHGLSDTDILAVLHSKRDSSVFDDGDILNNIQEYLITQEENRTGLDRKKIDVSVSGVPIIRKKKGKKKEVERSKAFYQEDEFINFVGKDYEAAWASFERASLLFESALIYGNRDADISLRKRIDDNLYGLAQDIEKGHFPLPGYCLAQYIAQSGLLAKAAVVRKSQNDSSRVSSETLKAVFSRVWNANVNLVAIHVFFWHQLISGNRRTDSEILEDFRRPPIELVLDTLPLRLQFVADEVHTKLELASLLPTSQDALHIFDQLLTIQSRIRPVGDKGVIPLWHRFLQIANLCGAARRNRSLIDPDMVEKLVLWNRELQSLLDDCSAITRTINLNSGAHSEGVKLLHTLLADNIHGLSNVPVKRGI